MVLPAGVGRTGWSQLQQHSHQVHRLVLVISLLSTEPTEQDTQCLASCCVAKAEPIGGVCGNGNALAVQYIYCKLILNIELNSNTEPNDRRVGDIDDTEYCILAY